MLVKVKPKQFTVETRCDFMSFVSQLNNSSKFHVKGRRRLSGQCTDQVEPQARQCCIRAYQRLESASCSSPLSASHRALPFNTTLQCSSNWITPGVVEDNEQWCWCCVKTLRGRNVTHIKEISFCTIKCRQRCVKRAGLPRRAWSCLFNNVSFLVQNCIWLRRG